MEQQLTTTDDRPIDVHWLSNKPAFQHLRATLPLEWLERFPNMPLQTVSYLFDLAASYAERSILVNLIGRRASEPLIVPEGDEKQEALALSRKKFWQLASFLYQAPSSYAAWQCLKTDPNTIFDLEYRLSPTHVKDSNIPNFQASMIYQIFDAFVDVWKEVPLPNSSGPSSPKEERAYRFLHDVIWRIKDDVTEHRVPVLEKMLADPRFQSFSDSLLTLRAETFRETALKNFRAPAPLEINGLLDKNQVATVEDLRALMVEELVELQKWLKGSETDPLDAFYSGGKRVDENTARNRIVDRLQGQIAAKGLSVNIERHMVGGTRCDIAVSTLLDGKSRLLVVEVKGQWNRELYTAAQAQLDTRYAIHPDAADQGVYLVLWYGNGETVAGKTDPTIQSADQLKRTLFGQLPEDLRRRIDIVVLDLSRL
jgi:hypothetical protein